MASQEDDISRAIETAKKLASSTNSSSNANAANLNSWQQYNYSAYPPMVPPPGYGGFPAPQMYGYGDFGMQGMNFSAPLPKAPATIPQMSAPPLPPAQAPNFNQVPPPPPSACSPSKFSSFNNTNNNSSNSNTNAYGSPQPQSSGSGSAYQQWIQSRQLKNQQSQSDLQQSPLHLQPQAMGVAGGPKPIRFNIQPKRGGGGNTNSGKHQQHQYGSTNNPNTVPLAPNNKIGTGSFSGVSLLKQGGYVSNSDSGNSNSNNVNTRNWEQGPGQGSSNGLGLGQGGRNSSNMGGADSNWGSNGYVGGDKRTALLPTPSQQKKQMSMSGSGDGESSGPSSLTQQQINNAMDPSDWPPSLQEYVYRCYALCANDVDKDRVDIILKGKVIRAAAAQVLQTKDWTKEPLPEISEGQVKALPFQPLNAPIKGKITGKPIIMLDEAPLRGTGRRGRGGGRGLTGKRGKDSSRGLGRGGGRNFRSRSTSSSRSSSSGSRSSSESSRASSGFNRKNKRRRRSDSPDFNDYYNSPLKKGGKNSKTTKKNKLQRGKNKGISENPAKPVHMYSEYGIMQVGDEVQSTAKMSARAARFAKDNPGGGKSSKTTTKRASMKSRLGGFDLSRSIAAVPWAVDTNPSSSYDMNMADATVVGTCMDLEKRYLRLTSAPEASTIRPVHVLKKSLEMVKRKWKETADYFYACDQLKSIRQDLTVQRVRNEFTVNVYETHARIALEKGDHEEFNQCQSQLVQLYPKISSQFKVEFTAYRILYYIFTANTLDLGTVMCKLTDDEKDDESIRHALEVRSAWAIKNFPKIFKLHNRAPKMAGYLIDWFANRERKQALKSVLKAYRPIVPIDFVMTQLGLAYESDWNAFLTATSLENAIVYADAPHNTKINAKDTYPLVLAALPSK